MDEPRPTEVYRYDRESRLLSPCGDAAEPPVGEHRPSVKDRTYNYRIEENGEAVLVSITDGRGRPVRAGTGAVDRNDRPRLRLRRRRQAHRLAGEFRRLTVRAVLRKSPRVDFPCDGTDPFRHLDSGIAFSIHRSSTRSSPAFPPEGRVRRYLRAPGGSENDESRQTAAATCSRGSIPKTGSPYPRVCASIRLFRSHRRRLCARNVDPHPDRSAPLADRRRPRGADRLASDRRPERRRGSGARRGSVIGPNRSRPRRRSIVRRTGRRSFANDLRFSNGSTALVDLRASVTEEEYRVFRLRGFEKKSWIEIAAEIDLSDRPGPLSLRPRPQGVASHRQSSRIRSERGDRRRS